MNTTVKLTVRLSPRLHEKVRRRALETQQSLNRVIENAIESGLEQQSTRYPESEQVKVLRVLRESGLYEPMGKEWKTVAGSVPDMTHAELREMLKGVPPLSEAILEERDSKR